MIGCMQAGKNIYSFNDTPTHKPLRDLLKFHPSQFRNCYIKTYDMKPLLLEEE